MKICQKTLNYLMSLTAQSISNAGSGHTGSSLGGAAILLALFKDHYNFDVAETDFLNRDRFVLSAGHAAPLYYTLLSMFGFDVTLQDLKELRAYGSRTPGHPEYKVTDGVEVSTGPLGQGVANAVGLAIAQSILEERFNTVGFPIFDNYTYCYAGDGCLMEGVALEACSLAGTLNLKRLILLYDSNDVTLDGTMGLSNRENIAKKFSAMGWNVIKVRSGNDFDSCSRAIGLAKRSDKPTIIIFKTTIGIGTDKAGTSAIHGIALKQEEVDVLNQKLGVIDKFFIPSDVRDFCMASTRAGKLRHEEWNQLLAIYSNSNPELYRQFMNFFDRSKFDPVKILKNSYKWENMSMRDVNHIILNEIAEKMLQMVGGSADLSSSTKVFIENASNFMAANKRGRNIYFGVREHAMGAICNGIGLYEDFIPFCSTFLSFSNYMLPSIRMSALMNVGVLYFFTHDSIIVGQDGPTHQPIEQIEQLRSIINLNVVRPCDSKELMTGYTLAISKNEPTALIVTKEVPAIIDKTSYEGALKGAYPLKEAANPDIVIYSSGLEVALAMEVAADLKKSHSVTVVSVPCFELFERQPQVYQNKMMYKNAKLKVAIEASNDAHWYKLIGENGLFIGVNDYQKSGPSKEVYVNAGFNSKDIVKKIQKALGQSKKQNVTK